MKAAILLSIFISAFALDCPAYRCTDLKDGICAENVNGVILLNQLGCNAGEACDFSQVWDPTGELPSNKVPCVSENKIDTDPLENLNVTELFAILPVNETAIAGEEQLPANITSNETAIAGEEQPPANITTNETAIAGEEQPPANITSNQTAIAGGEQGNQVNITTNQTTTEVSVSNSTSGGLRRLQGPRGGVGAAGAAGEPGAAGAAGAAGATTNVNVTTIPPTSNATTPEGNATTSTTLVNVTSVSPSGNVTEISQPAPEVGGNATVIVPNETAAEAENATEAQMNLTQIPAEAENATEAQMNLTQIAGGEPATNITAEQALAIATLQNTPVISSNATNTTLDISNIVESLSPFIQETKTGYEVDIPGIGIVVIKSKQEKKKIICQKILNRNLESGSNPKMCDTDADCLLQDGSLAKCVCGLDAQSYCQPDYYDDVFSTFTDKCVDDKMDETVFVEWIRYHIYYVALNTDPGCGQDIFLQLKKASKSEEIASEIASSGGILAYTLMMVLLLMA